MTPHSLREGGSSTDHAREQERIGSRRWVNAGVRRLGEADAATTAVGWWTTGLATAG